MEALRWIAVAVIGYLLGNISFGVILSRLIAHQDVRQQGSGSTGTTNMFRMLGMKVSLMTLLGDMLKAIAASLIGRWLLGGVGPYWGVDGAAIGSMLGGIMAVAGHNWPALLRFKGGKGIAATAGAIVASQPWLGLVLTAVAIVSIRVIKIVSIVSLVSVTLYAALTFIFWWGQWPYCVFSLLLMGMAFFSHRANIRRLLDGTEKNNSLDFSKGKKST